MLSNHVMAYQEALLIFMLSSQIVLVKYYFYFYILYCALARIARRERKAAIKCVIRFENNLQN